MICDETDQTPALSSADQAESLPTENLFVPEPVYSASLDTFTCGVSWSPAGDSCAVATQTRLHVFAGVGGAVLLQPGECLHRGQNLPQHSLPAGGQTVCQPDTQVQYSTVQYSTVQYSTVQHSTCVSGSNSGSRSWLRSRVLPALQPIRG